MSYFEQFTDFQPGGEEVPSKYLEAIRVFYADPGTVLLTFLITIRLELSRRSSYFPRYELLKDLPF